jgi:hypothetical protein
MRQPLAAGRAEERHCLADLGTVSSVLKRLFCSSLAARVQEVRVRLVGDLAYRRATRRHCQGGRARDLRRFRVGMGEHEAGEAIGKRRLADALRPTDQPGVVHAARAVRVEQHTFGGRIAEPRRLFLRRRPAVDAVEADQVVDVGGRHRPAHAACSRRRDDRRPDRLGGRSSLRGVDDDAAPGSAGDREMPRAGLVQRMSSRSNRSRPPVAAWRLAARAGRPTGTRDHGEAAVTADRDPLRPRASHRRRRRRRLIARVEFAKGRRHPAPGTQRRPMTVRRDRRGRRRKHRLAVGQLTASPDKSMGGSLRPSACRLARA